MSFHNLLETRRKALTRELLEAEAKHERNQARMDFVEFLAKNASEFGRPMPDHIFDLKVDPRSEEDEDLAEEYYNLVMSTTAEYLSIFTKIIKEEGKVYCLCGKIISGSSVLDSFMSTFQWGITHGEGFCAHCHLPVRMKHRIYEDTADPSEEEPLVQFTFPLIYHPDGLEINAEETKSTG